MAVSDLTNTKWLFNDEPSLADEEWFINFISNNQTFDTINPSDASEVMHYYYNNYSVTIDAYNENFTPRWVNDAYKTIEITGGQDVTNSTLIAWLGNNATQIVEAGKTQLGTRAITKKMFGTREITKEVVNGVVVYEKQAPSGYTVQILTSIGYSGEANNAKYSLDDGTTWVTLYDAEADPPQYKTITLNNVTQIKFMCDDPNLANWGVIESTQLNLELDGDGGPNYSQNYVLTQDITDVRAYTFYD